MVHIRSGGLLRVNDVNSTTQNSSIIATDQGGGFIQIKVGDQTAIEGSANGSNAEILIELSGGRFSAGFGEIPAGESGTVGLVSILSTNASILTSFRDVLFDPGTVNGSRGSGGANATPDTAPSAPTTLAAQTLDYDAQAGEQDRDEEECPLSDPACRPEEAGLLDVSAVLPDVPTQ